jgi:hypothetical protein
MIHITNFASQTLSRNATIHTNRGYQLLTFEEVLWYFWGIYFEIFKVILCGYFE